MTVSVKLTPDQMYRAADVARLLGISRATFYRIAWFKSRKVPVAGRAVAWTASDIALYQSIRRGAA